jgi:hypothetical protein
MSNPYASKAETHFWRTAIADVEPSAVSPLPAKRFTIERDAAIATAGSCFAQNVANYLRQVEEIRFIEAEPVGPGQPLFSALYGNIYTARHLLQLTREAFGAFRPADTAWQRDDGTYIDPFRPNMFAEGFATPDLVRAARERHLAAVRRVLQECSIFVFTLGLTETWASTRDGAVFPLAPGTVTSSAEASAAFHNFTYSEVLHDMRAFLAEFRTINPISRVLLTVSPVPLTATYTDEHVLVATTHSKAILRAVCSELVSTDDRVFYFPSFEIISGHYNRGAYYGDNLRTVTGEGIAHVMRVFRQTYLDGVRDEARPVRPRVDAKTDDEDTAVCDEEEIVKSLGFGD